MQTPNTFHIPCLKYQSSPGPNVLLLSGIESHLNPAWNKTSRAHVAVVAGFLIHIDLALMRAVYHVFLHEGGSFFGPLGLATLPKQVSRKSVPGPVYRTERVKIRPNHN